MACSGSCDNNCSSCSSADCGERKAPQKEAANQFSNIKKVIGVVSGKGGVGKSLVTSLMACEVMKQGKKAAILDADITGPSIPKVFGIHQRAVGNAQGILACESEHGTKVMSVNLLLENETDPVLLRGPIIAGTVKQFWTDVVWGDVDCMFVDMPPGTGDVPLTVFQSIPLDGIVIVASPQELVGMIVEKAVKMANEMNIPVLGLVENMAYFECPDCGKRHEIFGASHVEEMAKQYGIENTAQIPMAPAMAAACDAGKIEEFDAEWLKEFAGKIL